MGTVHKRVLRNQRKSPERLRSEERRKGQELHNVLLEAEYVPVESPFGKAKIMKALAEGKQPSVVADELNVAVEYVYSVLKEMREIAKQEMVHSAMEVLAWDVAVLNQIQQSLIEEALDKKAVGRHKAINAYLKTTALKTNILMERQKADDKAARKKEEDERPFTPVFVLGGALYQLAQQLVQVDPNLAPENPLQDAIEFAEQHPVDEKRASEVVQELISEIERGSTNE